eukprot:TRINITY_DN23782_c0_g1_i1.p1 TRINITY_DN23782_c0_g1~~TRINITY_DN23782_c0_g1_i1.p1  ORF type:complete len:239 (+),score=66.83 TRINITY_DN23782_c0_g1_i1:42-719(+)
MAAVGVGSMAAASVPAMLLEKAGRDCCEVVLWCCDRVGLASVIDCSFGPYYVGDGMFAWLQAERGSFVRVLDLGHRDRIHYNPARNVVPMRALKGNIIFQVSATHRLLPTKIEQSEWCVMIGTLQRLHPNTALDVVTQALRASPRLLVVESPPKLSFASAALWYATPTEKRPVCTTVSDLMRRDESLRIMEHTSVGAFDCYVLMKPGDSSYDDDDDELMPAVCHI